MMFPAQIRLSFILICFAGSDAFAGPFVPAGDVALRADIQRLADHGIIKGPTSTWPLAWGPILEDLGNVNSTQLPAAILSSLHRIRDRADWETRTTEVTLNAKVAVADNPTRIRSYRNTPRGKAEVSAGVGWTGDWFSVDLNVQGVDSDQDSEQFRADDSMIGVILGNWSVAASTQQRWWGPGWDGSLILSNNARPIPSLTN